VLDRLRELNPVINKRRKHKHHQFLSEDIGEPTVDRHLASVTTLMAVANDKKHFDHMFRIVFPKLGEQLVMGSILHPALPESTDDDGAAEETIEVGVASPTSASAEVGGIAVVVGSPRVSEKVVARLRQGEAEFNELAIAAYGRDARGPEREAKNTATKLRFLLTRMAGEGLIVKVAERRWRLANAATNRALELES
jgi:hypothetical protein